jgi:hypothetical protein
MVESIFFVIGAQRQRPESGGDFRSLTATRWPMRHTSQVSIIGGNPEGGDGKAGLPSSDVVEDLRLRIPQSGAVEPAPGAGVPA